MFLPTLMKLFMFLLIYEIPGHLSSLLFLHLKVVIHWVQIEVLELDPNLVE